MNEVNKARTARLANALKTNSVDLERTQSMRNGGNNGNDDWDLDSNEFRRRASTAPSKHKPIMIQTPNPTELIPSTPPLDRRGSSLETDEPIVVERMRTFTLDPEKATVVNRGDSFRCRSSTGISSTGIGRRRSLNGSSRNSSNLSSQRHSPVPQEIVTSPVEILSPSLPDDGVRKYHIVVLGSANVGKTAMINQFMTSEYCNPFQNDSVEYPNDYTVNVLLDDEESQLTFIEVNNEKSDMWLSLSGAAYIITYSIDDLASFRNAEQALCELRQRNHAAKKPIILVANKIDLERKRHVSTEDGRRAAREWNCKFVEIAVVLGHHVDELLVGVLAQARLDQTHCALDVLHSPTDTFQVPNRSSSGSSCGSSHHAFRRWSKRGKHKANGKMPNSTMGKCQSLRKLDQAVSNGRAHISSVGERFVQKLMSWRRRSHSLEDLLALQRR